ncbi:serine/threonine protein kinase [Candidatus Uabimicrobium amorphum]|uniref:non-specific serine/threonine protein kinase n=1 Tax=Uabimicrobium amorphum TaxID=2596890 RepID=A0A5S9F1M1_UABAM|nr:serine/threonine-protein kinase [Candidatus Uabimicrobium amorphum]BBM82716.1 protein kinase [Candidatus Uabimicrobium amorphum]
MNIKNLAKDAMVLHYKIEKKLGQGGMGVVYKAIDTKLQRNVAIKFLLGNYDEKSAKTQRFWEEARSVAQLMHGNIMGIHHLETHNTPFLVMSYIEGMSLQKKLKNHRFAIPETVKCIIKIAQAMHYAHQQGVIHRDLKPENIMIDNNNEPIIMDFGLAKRRESDTKISRAGDIFGTPRYMSPEQAKGENDTIDHRTDIFSLGIILYEMLTESIPFKGDSVFMMMRATVEKDPVPPREINPQIPVALEKVCLKALAKSREDRYSTAQEFAHHLQHLLSPQTQVLPQTHAAPRKKRIAPRKMRTSKATLASQKTVLQTQRHNKKFIYSMVGGIAGIVVIFMVLSFSGNDNAKTEKAGLFEEYMQKAEKAFIENNYVSAREYLRLALEQQPSEKAQALLNAIDLAEKKTPKTPLQLVVGSPTEEVKTNQNVWVIRGRVTGESPRVFCGKIDAQVNDNQFELRLPLEGEGKKQYQIVATDQNGKRQQTVVYFLLDKTPPVVSVDAPQFIIEKQINIRVDVSESNPWKASIDGKILPTKGKESFVFVHSLVPGENNVTLKVEDCAGNITTKKFSTNYSDKCPPPTIVFPKKNNFSTPRKRIKIKCLADPLYDRVYVNKKVATRFGKYFTRMISLSKGENSIQVVANDRFDRKSHKEFKIYRTKNILEKIKDGVERKKQLADKNNKVEDKNARKRHISTIMKKNFHATDYKFKDDGFVEMTYVFNDYSCLQDFDIIPNATTQMHKDHFEITAGLIPVGMSNKVEFNGDVAVEISFLSNSTNRSYALGVCFAALNGYTLEIDERKGHFVLRKGIGLFAPALVPPMKNKSISVNRNRMLVMKLTKKGNLITGQYKKRTLCYTKNAKLQKGRVGIVSFLNTSLKLYKLKMAGYVDQQWLQKLR